MRAWPAVGDGQLPVAGDAVRADWWGPLADENLELDGPLVG
jgi:hypothetical protein